MIIVALNGGLGNQLFQYAAGRALAVSRNTNLSLDLIPLSSKLQLKNIATYRPYELSVFLINATINQPIFTNRYLYPFAKANYYVNKLRKRMMYNYVKEHTFEYDETLLLQPDNTYLDGHFQSEKYFKKIEQQLRNELTFKHPLDDYNNRLSEQIINQNSVAIHIRRGDYLLNTNNLNKHGLTPLSYYFDAVNYIAARINNPVFYIFSDDADWVKAQFDINHNHIIINHNTLPETSYIDMQLMSLCKHNIIANSTFSWWGAWLNSNPNKIVIAPKQWFTDTSINSNDIYPFEWIKL